MSSAFLYLAIVVMWLCVLIPMWLRRDRHNLAELEETYELTGPLLVNRRAAGSSDFSRSSGSAGSSCSS